MKAAEIQGVNRFDTNSSGQLSPIVSILQGSLFVAKFADSNIFSLVVNNNHNKLREPKREELVVLEGESMQHWQLSIFLYWQYVRRLI